MIIDSSQNAKPLPKSPDDETAPDSNHSTLQSTPGPSDNPPPPPYLPTESRSPAPTFVRDGKNPIALSPSQNSYIERSPNPSNGDGWTSQGSSPYLRPQRNYPSFEPMFLISVGQYLTRGFPPMAPPSKNDPHPFVTHEIPDAEWLRFLAEVKAAGQLSEDQKRYSHLPIVSIIPIVDSLSSHLIRLHMKKGKTKEVAKVIDTWNHNFFNSRQIQVVLMQGATKLSGLSAQFGPNASIPGPSIQMASSELSVEKGKGKAKEEEDTTFRLFVMPLSS